MLSDLWGGKKIYNLVFLLFVLLALPIAIYLVDRQTSFFEKAYGQLAGTKAELIINLAYNFREDGYSWNNLAQGGEEVGGMLAPVLKELASLKPRYVRLDHIYDFYDVVKRSSGGDLVYDWSRLDRELAVIGESGAKPFLSLSYMPGALTSGQEVDLPVSWDEWRRLVRATIEHVSGKENLAISDVYYEVWNEPDLFGEFKTYGDKNYLFLYLYASQGAETAENVYPFKLGGPSTSALYRSWFDAFFKFALKNNLRVDFYSWHRYSRYMDDYAKDIVNTKLWLVNYPKYAGVEFIITEAGYTSEVDEDYDKKFSAIHTLAMYSSTFQKIGKVFTFEIKDGPGDEKYWGRWGLLTHESYGAPEEKPRYKAIQFLNRMKGGWYTIFGEGTWVKAIASENEGIVRTLIVNYDPFKLHRENVELEYINIPFKSFTARRIDFLGGISESEVNLTEDFWKTTYLFEPNSAAIIELIPNSVSL
jgi:hypothetical protein